MKFFSRNLELYLHIFQFSDINHPVAVDWLNDGVSIINQRRIMMCLHLHARAVQDDLTRKQLKKVVREYVSNLNFSLKKKSKKNWNIFYNFGCYHWLPWSFLFAYTYGSGRVTLGASEAWLWFEKNVYIFFFKRFFTKTLIGNLRAISKL